MVIINRDFIGAAKKFFYLVSGWSVVYDIIQVCFTYHTVYKDLSEAVTKHPDVDVMVNFASLRSAYEATMDTLKYPQVYTYLCIYACHFSVHISNIFLSHCIL